MCRNIKTLFNFDPPVTPDEVHAASLQFVRKITGFNKPSKANEAAFNAAIEEVAAAESPAINTSGCASSCRLSFTTVLPIRSWGPGNDSTSG